MQVLTLYFSENRSFNNQSLILKLSLLFANWFPGFEKTGKIRGPERGFLAKMGGKTPEPFSFKKLRFFL
jgi:hypothetical protein